jgi:hypothetical protein
MDPLHVLGASRLSPLFSKRTTLQHATHGDPAAKIAAGPRRAAARLAGRARDNQQTPCAQQTSNVTLSAMSTPSESPRHSYQAWIEEQIEEYKAALTRDELLDLAEVAVEQLFDAPDGQYPLTEILLCDAVDRLLLQRLDLPDYRQWQRMCRKDTTARPHNETQAQLRAAG